MDFSKLFLLLLSSSALLFALNTTEDHNTANKEEAYITPPQICYRFSKEDFIETLETPKDIIVNITDIYESKLISFKFASSHDIPYTDEVFFECVNDGDHSNKFGCFKSNSINKLQVQLRDDALYLHVDYVQMSSVSEALLHSIKSKNQTFIKGIKSPCYLSVEPRIEVEDVKKGSKKEKLLQSISINDVIIYDLDHHEDLAVAVGSDNSPEVRAAQYMDRTYASVIIRSTDGGKTWQRVEGEEYAFNHNVIVLDEKRIIVSSEIDGAGGTLQASYDGGESWKNIFDNGENWEKSIGAGRITSLKQIAEEVIVTREMGTTLRSKDGGKSWHETPVVEKKESEKKTSEEVSEQNVPLSIDDGDTLSVLTVPGYRVDYETNTLIVQHHKKTCDCTQFTLPLTYNISNTRKGLLGPYWSLGIENHITISNRDRLLFFDANKGKEKLYLRNKVNKSIFRYGGETIQKTKNGYTRTCDPSKQYFDLNGYLIKIEYPENSYIIHYQNNKIHKVTELVKGMHKPYLSFAYNYEGVVVTFHQTKERKVITLLRDTEGVLSSILDGNHHIFHYVYDGVTTEEKKLSEIQDISKFYPYATLFEFHYLGEHETIVHDFRQCKNDVIKEKNYLHYDKDKEHICIVNTLKKRLQKEVLQDVESEINMYRFNYHDISKKRLSSTQYGSQTYSFDKAGRVNFYSDNEGNISVIYSKFYKITNSIAYKERKASKYSYTYTDDNKHNLKTITSPQGTVELSYNKHGQIKEMKIDKHHLKFEYNKHSQPTKIIVVGKGEVVTTYDDKHEIKNVEYALYDKTIDDHAITLDVTRAMSLLIQRTSEGTIKNYPGWVW